MLCLIQEVICFFVLRILNVFFMHKLLKVRNIKFLISSRLREHYIGTTFNKYIKYRNLSTEMVSYNGTH